MIAMVDDWTYRDDCSMHLPTLADAKLRSACSQSDSSCQSLRQSSWFTVLFGNGRKNAFVPHQLTQRQASRLTLRFDLPPMLLVTKRFWEALVQHSFGRSRKRCLRLSSWCRPCLETYCFQYTSPVPGSIIAGVI